MFLFNLFIPLVQSGIFLYSDVLYIVIKMTRHTEISNCTTTKLNGVATYNQGIQLLNTDKKVTVKSIEKQS